MFKFLKNKLKKFSKDVEESSEEITEEEKEVEKLGEDLKEEKIKESKKKIKEEKPKKEGIVKKLKKAVSKKISDKKFEELFWDLELGLLESNVAVEVIEKLKESLRMEIVNVPIKGKVDEFINEKLKESIKELFDNELDLVEKIKKSDKPYVVLFLGVNGSGKTTSIAKFAKLLKTNGLSCVMAAADTFRAAAIDQLSLHGEKLDVKVIKHDYGSDAAAVAFDAVRYAESKGTDVVLVDGSAEPESDELLYLQLSLLPQTRDIIRKLPGQLVGEPRSGAVVLIGGRESPYLQSIVDGWEEPLIYTGARIYSSGPDRQYPTGDDISDGS